ncbi:MAG: glycoside hydrolase family 3 C-terminal domain-containing protein [Clostridia bacterium]|nr:glycoside hydrolase family 3 C-terminal domain-containing protein [Clostridia bacterium]
MMKYKDKNLSPEERAQDLLSRMTFEEKYQQINFNPNVNRLYEELKEKGDVEIRFGTFHLPLNPDVVDTLQDYCLNKTRLGIPLLINWEGIHGLMNEVDEGSINDPHLTVFPQCLGLASTFNRDYVYNMAKQIGIEAQAYGVKLLYAPNIDVSRDPRWGRTQENYGEDPYLTGEMGVAYVTGLQDQGVGAMAKHYIAYGVSEGGINIAPAHVGEREVREVMLEPFKKCVDAGVLGIMPAYNELDGDALHASKKYMRDILRGELGFNGITVSDYGAIRLLRDHLGVAKDAFEAGKLALEAGVDIEAPFSIGYADELKQALLNGEVDMSLLDEAVLRILTVKFKLGLFENPYVQRDKIPLVHSEETVKLVREMEEDGIVLLENDGILPLDEKKVGKVAVIGNNAYYTFQGDYTGSNKYNVNFLQGMVNRLGEENVMYALGCHPITTTDELIEEAVETAKKADTVFLVLGSCSNVGGGEQGFSTGDDNKQVTDGEGHDITDLGLMPSQQRLFDAITALGKPTVLIMYSGRPLALVKEAEKVNALLWSFGGGEQTGNAMANILFGDKSPSGKLAVSFPIETGAIPCYYNYKVSARGFYKNPGSVENPGRDYVITDPAPWYPFGYGLSYTNVEYSNLKAEVKGNKVEVSVDVANTGNYAINESVLVYVRTMYCNPSPFIKKLRNFDKVYLEPGDKKTVNFTLTEEDFSYIDFDYKTAVAHGDQKIIVEDMEVDIVY